MRNIGLYQINRKRYKATIIYNMYMYISIYISIKYVTWALL